MNRNCPECRQYFGEFWSMWGWELPNRHGQKTQPVHVNYWGYPLLSDAPSHFVPNFHVQFINYLTRNSFVSPRGKELIVNSARSDKLWWSMQWGKVFCSQPGGLCPVRGANGRQIWGLGAGE